MKKEFKKTTFFSSKIISKNIYVLKLDNVFTEMPQCGQFVMLEPLNQGSCMPRPFSIVYADKNHVYVLIEKVGKNTELYFNLERGDEINISGPLGKPFAFFNRHGQKYLLVAGGTGVAALLWIGGLLWEDKSKSKFMFGARTKEEVSAIKEGLFAYAKNFKAISEEGKNGGTVIDLLKEELKNDRGKSIIVSCGPIGMLRAVAETAKAFGNKCFVSLETVMACGVNACKGCAVFGVDETVKHVCEDGPFFNAEWLDWKKLAPSLNFPSLPKISSKTKYPMRVVLKGQNGRKLILPSPVINSSGCLSEDVIKSGYVDISCFGALVTKGVKLNPTVGNPSPRICETESGMINSIGLENSGLEKFLDEELPYWLSLGKRVIVNIAGNSIKEYVEIAIKLSKTKVSAIELNVSCPNVKDGTVFGTERKKLFQLVKDVRVATNKFLIVKLTPNVTDIVDMAFQAEFAGADAISAINTVHGMAVNIKTRRSKIARVTGGLSGPAIKPIGLFAVYKIAEVVRIPIIAMGGIETAEDAAEYIMVGASAVAVGTGLFKNPNAITEIHDGLLEIMKLHGANHVHDPRGSLII